MSEFRFQEMFPHGDDTTSYRPLGGDGIGTDTFRGESILTVEPDVLTRLAAEAIRDVSHLLRPGHLAQLRAILDDPEASDNDRFVALNLLRNACISAGMILPGCQDTGTAVVLGKKGQRVWVNGDDEAALARGIFETYATANLRYSQLAPLSLFEEQNTGTNLPAQIDLFATGGDAYDFLFVTKGGGSANKSFLFQETKAILNPDALIAFLDRGTAGRHSAPGRREHTCGRRARKPRQTRRRCWPCPSCPVWSRC
jgi:fumarate hydratase class I